MLKKSHIAQTADWEELYVAVESGVVVFSLALMPVQIPRRAMADPMHIPVVFSTRFCIYFARGIMGRHSIVMIGMRYPRVENVAATESAS